MTYVKQRKGWRMRCNVGEVTERLENELCFFRFSYVTSSSLNSPGEPPMAMRRYLSTPTLCRLLKYCYITSINVLNFINKIMKVVMKGGKIIK